MFFKSATYLTGYFTAFSEKSSVYAYKLLITTCFKNVCKNVVLLNSKKITYSPLCLSPDALLDPLPCTPCLQKCLQNIPPLFFYAVYLTDNMIYTQLLFSIPLLSKKRNFRGELKAYKTNKVSPEKRWLANFIVLTG
jgi:hypothetical protein